MSIGFIGTTLCIICADAFLPTRRFPKPGSESATLPDIPLDHQVHWPTIQRIQNPEGVVIRPGFVG